MNNFKPTIGIEIHTQVNTKTKMFSPSANNSNSIPNTNICEYDVALPGSMPQPNKEVVVKAIQFAKALNMQLDQSLRFDRKNYFYSDLPKGYQITQQYFPIAKNGKIKISDDKSIEIERFHLEEDTAKQIYETDEIKLDYNRSGIPLIEIVSCPQISSGEEAVLYLTKIKQILTFLEISDGKMEDGSLRVDVNISVSENEKLGTKVEIKNINSFSNAKRAIEFEIKRQEEILSSSNLVIQETRRWDEKTNSTIFMRNKDNAIDYRYMTEPNILTIKLDNDFVNNALGKMKKTPDEIAEILKQNNLNNNFISLLLNDYHLFKEFSEINDKINDMNLVSVWLLVELLGLTKKDNKTISMLDTKFFNNFIDFLLLLKENKINGKQGKQILEQMYSTNANPAEIIEKFAIKQIDNIDEINNVIEEIISKNQAILLEYKTNPIKVEKFLMGMIMKETKGQANPIITNDCLKKILARFN